MSSGWSEQMLRVGDHVAFVRSSAPVDGRVPIVHVHGFAISGTYLLPTARVLAARATNIVPDLPGYGRSSRWVRTLGIPELADALLRIIDALGHERVVLLGNSMGCPISLEVAHTAPERVDRMVLVAPAGGPNNQPLLRAIGQLARTSAREDPRMAVVAVPDYLRFGVVNALNLFAQLTHFPTVDRLLAIPVPTLAVLGARDPLMPPPERVLEIARQVPDHVTVATIEGAAHALNFSHPEELAHVVSSWLDGREIVDDPDAPHRTHVLEIPRDLA